MPLLTDPVFVVGAQRSGTTAFGLALANLYAARGATFTVNGRLPALLRRWCTHVDLDNRHLRADDIAHVLGRKPAYGPTAREWHERCAAVLVDAAGQVAAGAAPSTAVELAREIVVSSYAGPAWGDKYNEYLLDLDWLHALFPTARWVFLYRHPAAVVASMLRWHTGKVWNPRTARACEDKWIRWNAHWLSYRPNLSRDRVLTLSYDDICAGLVDGVDDFLGLPVRAALADFTRRHSDADPAGTGQAALDMWQRLAAPW